MSKNEQTKKKKIYFAHSISDYNTKAEKRALEMLELLGFEVINPNNEAFEKKYKKLKKKVGFRKAFKETFLDVISNCDAVAFMPVIFKDRLRITSGVVLEVEHALKWNKPVIQIPIVFKPRRMTKEETFEYLNEVSYE